MRVMSWTRLCHGLDWSHSLFYLTLLLWTRRMNGLADFSSKMMMMMMMQCCCLGFGMWLHCYGVIITTVGGLKHMCTDDVCKVVLAVFTLPVFLKYQPFVPKIQFGS